MSNEEIVQGVIETIDNANQHRIRLAELLSHLDEATQQIKKSSTDSESHIKEHFKRLRLALNEVLDERQSQLLEQVEEIRKDSLQPLAECRDMIEVEVANANSVLNEGKKLLCGKHEESQSAMISFKKKANELDLNSLPELPPLSDVACVFVDLPDAALAHLQEEIQDYGRVLSRAPVQISEVSERPGALLVKWAEIEEESALDLSEFRLQYLCGEVKASDSSSNLTFMDTYTGLGTSATVRHLKPMTSYTFRVCGRAEGAEVWSPWSIPHTAVTSLPHHEWQSDVKEYNLSYENKLAERVGGGIGPILYSNCASYMCGHTIKFKILEAGHVTLGDGIGLTTLNTHTESLQQQATLFISSQGTVYIDAQERTTKLPCLKRGSTLIFETEVLQSGKVRVTIEVDDRIATFDWSIEKPSSPVSQPASNLIFTANQAKEDTTRLFFAIKFAGKDWKVGVE